MTGREAYRLLMAGKSVGVDFKDGDRNAYVLEDTGEFHELMECYETKELEFFHV